MERTSFARWAIAALTLALSSGAWSRSRQVPAPAQPSPIVVHSATVHPVRGDVIQNGYVAFDAGRITAVSQGPVPGGLRGARQIDATGLHIYPGLIASDTTLGLTEVGAVPVTNDDTEFGRLRPEVRAAVAVNPDSDLIPVTRANGILTALILPQGGVISGRASLIRLDGWTWEDMSIQPDAGLVVNWPRTDPIVAWWMEQSPEEQRKESEEELRAIDRFFDEAAAYVAAADHDASTSHDLRHEAMRDVLSGAKPVLVRASASGQIESAVAWAARRHLRVIIVGGHEADGVSHLLKERDVPVIIDGLHVLPPHRHSAYDQVFTLPARLHAAGVRFCIASGAGAAHERNLNHVAATAAAFGLPREEALRSVTLSAAQILGLGESHGSLETGKSATLIVTTGDPLEIMTDTLLAFIDGRQIDLGTRHKSLYEKYRQKYVQLGILDE